jgi:hypothetical protein
MARIRMLTSVAGPDFAWSAGEEIDLPGAEAAQWADGVRAEFVRDIPLETPEATPATEKTSRRAAARRRPKAPER